MRRDGSQVVHVRESNAGQLLVALLRRLQPDAPASEAAQLLRNRRVQIDGNLCEDGRRRLKMGEVVKILPHAVAAPPSADDIHVHFADEQLVVVEKPSGMTTMRHAEEAQWSARRQRREPTLEDVLPDLLAQSASSSRGKQRRPIRLPRVIPVHRLDRDTSGLMVFARTTNAERSLVEQFREHSIDRAYLTIVSGEIIAQTIESFLARDRGDGKRGSVADPSTGQHAVTHVRPVEVVNGFTLVECRLETGRTHQIRIHLSEAGHPVCGDKEYRGPLGQKLILDHSGAPRLALHAAELGFEHPLTGESLHFETRLPRDLSDFLRKQRRT
ncbi:MAG: RluA family pseudouridine synthase [Planctomycetaceae bacterium]|nr:RluA family pseudouridine synthase [Planctomycetaceae bacterium]